MRPGRLLWVNHYALLPSEGGGTRHFELGRELVRRGWDVTLAASDYPYTSREYTRRRGARDRSTIRETVDGVQFSWLWASPFRGNDVRRLLNWISFSRSVTGELGSGKRFDVVIGSSPHPLAALAAWQVARGTGARFVLEVRDLWPESLVAAGGRRGPFFLAVWLVVQHLYRAADRVVVLAEGAGRYLEGRGIPPDRITFVPNGVDPAHFPPSCALAGDGGPLTFVYAGAHGPANGLDVVLEAADRLRARDDILFRLVGDGSAKSDLMEEAARRRLPNLMFEPSVPKQEIPGLLGSSTAGLMVLRGSALFRFGVSPNKLFDYLAAGLPVVSNVAGEVGDILEDASAGVQAADGSAAALAAAVERVADLSPEERRSMGAAGRQWVFRNRSRDVTAGVLDRMLGDVVS